MTENNDSAKVGIKKITLEAVITRADGTVEDLGVIAESEYEIED